jgi:hypothetical protein
MKKTIQLLITTLFFTLASTAVLANDKGVDTKQIFSNDKASGVIITMQPGATLPSVARPGARAVYFIKGGKLERIYPDGKIVKKEYKDGETAYLDKPEDQEAYAIKNVGKRVFKAYTVNIK